MSYFAWGLNALASYVLIEIIYYQYKRRKTIARNTIKEVLFTNDSATCCDRKYSKENSCGNKYCLKKNLNRIIELINKSQHSICIAMYHFELRELREALMRAKKRKVNIRIVTTRTCMQELYGDFFKLLSNGIPVRFPVQDEVSLLHHKFCILDGKDSGEPCEPLLPQQGVLLTGSLNWTLKSFSSNWENIVITSETSLVEKYQAEFNTIWNNLRVTE